MSTEIAEIKGRRESYRTSGNMLMSPEVKYVSDTISVTRFYGGQTNGAMIQLTLGSSHGYIQLTKEQVKELIQILTDCFDYDKYPSE